MDLLPISPTLLDIDNGWVALRIIPHGPRTFPTLVLKTPQLTHMGDIEVERLARHIFHFGKAKRVQARWLRLVYTTVISGVNATSYYPPPRQS